MVNKIAGVIVEVEKVLGVGKVVDVTTDNASAMMSAWAILHNICPGHMETGFLADVLTQAQVANFVRNHTAANSRFSAALRSSNNIDNSRSLKIPVATRWYSHYECVKLVVGSERIIRVMTSDSGLLAKYKPEKVATFKRIVLSETKIGTPPSSGGETSTGTLDMRLL
ncbi:hypothetical protein ON010_g10184 [Phytophthora cinnamomi]|nr:hypothetical protein ON010_g10184 [Phytophthora cinnamomi]